MDEFDGEKKYVIVLRDITQFKRVQLLESMNQYKT